MHLTIDFDQIHTGPQNKHPVIRVNLNGKDLYQGSVTNLYTEIEALDSNTLRIYFENKTHQDTACDQHGNIVNDMNFTVSSISVDGVEFKELLWKGKYISQDQTFAGCLFFGPAGHYEIVFDYPILKWRLREQGQPGWEQDYHYYETACKILDKLPGP